MQSSLQTAIWICVFAVKAKPPCSSPPKRVLSK
jgi:hypothetical protein